MKVKKIKVARLRQPGAVGNRPRRQHAARLSAAHTQMEQFDYHNIVNDIRISLFSSKLKVQSSKLKAQSSKLKAQSSKLLLPKATGLQALNFELIALSYTTTTLSELILNI